MRSYRRYWIVAAAAVMLIVFGVLAVRLRTNISELPRENAENNQPKPAKDIAPEPPAPEPQQAGPEEKRPTPQPKKVFTPRRPRPDFMAKNQRGAGRDSQRAMANQVEVATDYMPLGYVSQATLQEGGQIVRVELPRSALVSYGLPVNMDRYNERVKADVLFGVDGLARAIRFVQ